MNSKENQNIRWTDIKNWWPILGALVAMTLWITAQIQDVRSEQVSMKKDIGYVIENTKTINTNVGKIQDEHQVFSNRLTTLEVLHR